MRSSKWLSRSPSPSPSLLQRSSRSTKKYPVPLSSRVSPKRCRALYVCARAVRPSRITLSRRPSRLIGARSHPPSRRPCSSSSSRRSSVVRYFIHTVVVTYCFNSWRLSSTLLFDPMSGCTSEFKCRNIDESRGRARSDVLPLVGGAFSGRSRTSGLRSG